ncbi:MAG TPA: cardiolipin synthase ClsB [Aquabacterium sp.]|nr:cardiolipin synthase ClsB [Aquabacterium sp.]
MPFDDDPEQALSLAWYAQRRPVFAGGHQVRLLKGGQQLFPAMVKAIDEAQHSVWLANYMVSPLGLPETVLQALSRAAERGVSVRMVIDGVGSHDAPGTTWSDLISDGVELVIYRPVRGWLSLLLDTRDWRRMHLKLCTVDDLHAFVGGINLIDDHHDLAHGWSTHPRLDYAVQFNGPALLPVLHTIRAMWTRATLGRDWRDDLSDWVKEPGRLTRLRALWQQARLKLPAQEQRQLAAWAKAPTAMRAAFVVRDNIRQRRTIERATLQALQQARYRIDLVCPYFYPGRVMRRALTQAASRGVKVRLLLQGKPDYALAALAARVLYAEFQTHGVRVFEYQPALLHAKVICVDEEWTSIGSSNLDPLSLQMNLEANLIVKDRGFAQTVSQSLQQDFADSLEISRHQVQQPRWWTRPVRSVFSWTARAYLKLGGVARRRRPPP